MTSRGRLNARLDPERERKVEYLRRRTGGGMSDVIRASIDHYYDAVHSAGSDARAILEACGFVASGSGPADLSERYKQRLAGSLHRKHS